MKSLAWRLDENLHTRPRTLGAVGVPKSGPAPRRQLRKIFVEVGRDRAEDRLVARLLLFAELAAELVEVSAGACDVVQLGAHRLEPLPNLSPLRPRQHVGRPHLSPPPLPSPPP